MVSWGTTAACRFTSCGLTLHLQWYYRQLQACGYPVRGSWRWSLPWLCAAGLPMSTKGLSKQRRSKRLRCSPRYHGMCHISQHPCWQLTSLPTGMPDYAALHSCWGRVFLQLLGRQILTGKFLTVYFSDKESPICRGDGVLAQLDVKAPGCRESRVSRLQTSLPYHRAKNHTVLFEASTFCPAGMPNT